MDLERNASVSHRPNEPEYLLHGTSFRAGLSERWKRSTFVFAGGEIVAELNSKGSASRYIGDTELRHWSGRGAIVITHSQINIDTITPLSKN